MLCLRICYNVSQRHNCYLINKEITSTLCLSICYNVSQRHNCYLKPDIFILYILHIYTFSSKYSSYI